MKILVKVTWLAACAPPVDAMPQRLLLDTCQPPPAYRLTSGNNSLSHSSSRTASWHHSSHFEMEKGVTRRVKLQVRPTVRGLDVLRERSKERALARELLRNRAGQISPVSVSPSLRLSVSVSDSQSFTLHAFPKLFLFKPHPSCRRLALRHTAKISP